MACPHATISFTTFPFTSVSAVAAAVAIGQLLVIQAEQVQDRRVQIVDVHLALHGFGAVVVGRP